MKATDQEFSALMCYVSTNYPPNGQKVDELIQPIIDRVEQEAYNLGRNNRVVPLYEFPDGDLSHAVECLDQLTAILRAAGKCQPLDTPRKVTLAKRELEKLAFRAYQNGTAKIEQVHALEIKHAQLRDRLMAVLNED